MAFNSQGNVLFLSFSVNLLHTCMKISRIRCIFSHFILPLKDSLLCLHGKMSFHCGIWFIMRILFDCKYDEYHKAFRFVSVNRNYGTTKPLSVCSKANCGNGLSAATKSRDYKEGPLQSKKRKVLSP